MVVIHAPERKYAVSIRFTHSEWARIRARARADDRSLGNWVTRVVRAELDRLDNLEEDEG